MSHGPRYYVKPRRRREGKTDYRKRLSLLKSGKIRMVVRKSLKYTQVQFIEYKEHGDNVLAFANSKELKEKFNWNFSASTTPAAYLTALLAGTRAKEKGITECVLDIGRFTPSNGCKIFAALKGVIDAGLTCPFNEEKLPSEDRIMGKHLGKEIAPSVIDIKSKIIGGK
ncbi:MAG: 50S ribosomal protein L18 [Candidatus Thermoplasmatota archaeon]|jgi:large subunit ribosomal protein L18|nr:50S ribosomal protein L18 [Candidatus Thermoplasmatota archaeon]